MSDLVHADIFFFISAIGIVVLTIGAAVTFYYVIGIVRDLREVARKVRTTSDELEKDFVTLRTAVKLKGAAVRSLFDLFMNFVTRDIPNAINKKRTKKASAKSKGTHEKEGNN